VDVNKHPILFLKDVKYTELKALLQFMYRGEVNIAREDFTSVLAVAHALKIRGLSEVDKGKGRSSDQQNPPDLRKQNRQRAPYHPAPPSAIPSGSTTNNYIRNLQTVTCFGTPPPPPIATKTMPLPIVCETLQSSLPSSSMSPTRNSLAVHTHAHKQRLVATTSPLVDPLQISPSQYGSLHPPLARNPKTEVILIEEEGVPSDVDDVNQLNNQTRKFLWIKHYSLHSTFVTQVKVEEIAGTTLVDLTDDDHENSMSQSSKSKSRFNFFLYFVN